MTAHLRLPLSLGPDGSFRTVEEDSPAEIMQNVSVVLRTRTGERLATPDLGTPDAAFVGFDTAAALDLVLLVEPRADLNVVLDVLSGNGLQTIDLEVGRQEST